MIRHTIGSRTGAPAFFDMGARFKPPGAGWYGGAFRIGDRAATYIWLHDWRLVNPDRKLVFIEDSVMAGTEASRYLEGRWLVGDIVDELWQITAVGEVIPRPAGDSIYHVTMWRIWKWLMTNKTFQPTIQPREDAVARVADILKTAGVTGPYVTVQPLFDAAYDVYRNAPPNWWRDIVHELSKHIKVLVLGDGRNVANLSPDGSNVVALWKYNLNPMESLAAISKALLHVGGETGTTLWAPILRIPTLACYRNWASQAKGYTDTRPISFGKPVVWSHLEGHVPELAWKALGIAYGHIIDSTPLLG